MTVDLNNYEAARDLMGEMVKYSQKPDDTLTTAENGNLEFVDTIGSYLQDRGFYVYTQADPEYVNRAQLVVDIGDPQGEQVLAAISHSDVVGVSGQEHIWETDPWELTEIAGKDHMLWKARGVCDTHGSGVAMLMAGSNPEVIEALERNGKKVSIVFTSDEEDADAEWSYRGAKVAVGEYGADPVITSKYFIAGEPTEPEDMDSIVARRAHKGRWLIKYAVGVERPGHSAENVQNAFRLAVALGQGVNEFDELVLREEDGGSIAEIFNPPYSTAQLTAADIKSDAFSITPGEAAFAVDLRTLPGKHYTQKRELERMLRNRADFFGPGVSFGIEEIDDFAGTETSILSPVVQAAAQATLCEVLGFNGGDEGEVLRRHGKEGVTIGPGKLSFAHKPNEEVSVDSVFNAAEIYGSIFKAATSFPQ